MYEDARAMNCIAEIQTKKLKFLRDVDKKCKMLVKVYENWLVKDKGLKQNWHVFLLSCHQFHCSHLCV